MTDDALTKETALAAFKAGKTIRDRNFSYSMNSHTGYIYGTCDLGTCDMDCENFDEWMKDSFDPSMRIYDE